MRILVTGATGFLGYHLCKRLVASGHQVTAFHRQGSRTTHLAALSIPCVEGDLLNLAGVRSAIAGHDLVVHAAADVTSWPLHPDAQNRINVEGTHNIALACRMEKTRRLLHVSSVCAIGIPEVAGKPAGESFPFNLRGGRYNYHISKKRGEEAVLEHVAQGLDAVMVNPGAIFGADPNGTKYLRGGLIQRAARSRIVPCFSGGICAVHIDDVVDGIVGAMQHGVTGERYILGGDNVSFREITRRSVDTLHLQRTLVPVPRVLVDGLMTLVKPISNLRHSMPRFAVHFGGNLFQYYSSEKAQRSLNYRPRPFQAIVEDCLAWSSHRERSAA